jgi:hypothetical protein
MDIDNLLLDLEVIKQIKENDKLALYVSPGKMTLFVDSFSYLSPFSRWYNGYNREESTAYIEKITESLEKASNNIIIGQHLDLANTLKEAITKSLIGLDNLKNTYSDDSVINSRVILIINKFKVVNQNLTNFVSERLSFDE